MQFQFFYDIINASLSLMISAPQVALKCRPLTGREGGRDIVRVTNDKVSTFFQKFRFFVCVCVCVRGSKSLYLRDNAICRRYLFWILTCPRTTLIAYKVGQRSENTISIMHLALSVRIRYVVCVCVATLSS